MFQICIKNSIFYGRSTIKSVLRYPTMNHLIREEEMFNNNHEDFLKKSQKFVEDSNKQESEVNATTCAQQDAMGIITEHGKSLARAEATQIASMQRNQAFKDLHGAVLAFGEQSKELLKVNKTIASHEIKNSYPLSKTVTYNNEYHSYLGNDDMQTTTSKHTYEGERLNIIKSDEDYEFNGINEGFTVKFNGDEACYNYNSLTGTKIQINDLSLNIPAHDPDKNQKIESFFNKSGLNKDTLIGSLMSEASRGLDIDKVLESHGYSIVKQSNDKNKLGL